MAFPCVRSSARLGHVLKPAIALTLLLSWSCTREADSSTSLKNAFSCVGATLDLFHDDLIEKVFVVVDGEEVPIPGPYDTDGPEFLVDIGSPQRRVRLVIRFTRPIRPDSIDPLDDFEPVIEGPFAGRPAEILAGGYLSGREFAFNILLGSEVAGASACVENAVRLLLKKEGEENAIESEEGEAGSGHKLEGDYILTLNFTKGLASLPTIRAIRYEDLGGVIRDVAIVSVLNPEEPVEDAIPNEAFISAVATLDPAWVRVKPHTRFEIVFSRPMGRVDHQVTPSGRVSMGTMESCTRFGADTSCWTWGDWSFGGLAINQSYTSVVWSALKQLPPEGHPGSVDTCGIRLGPGSYAAQFLTSAVRMDEVLGPTFDSSIPFPVYAVSPLWKEFRAPRTLETTHLVTVKGRRSIGGGIGPGGDPAPSVTRIRTEVFILVEDGGGHRLIPRGEVREHCLRDQDDPGGDPACLEATKGAFAVPVDLALQSSSGARWARKEQHIVIRVTGLGPGGEDLGSDEGLFVWKPKAGCGDGLCVVPEDPAERDDPEACDLSPGAGCYCPPFVEDECTGVTEEEVEREEAPPECTPTDVSGCTVTNPVCVQGQCLSGTGFKACTGLGDPACKPLTEYCDTVQGKCVPFDCCESGGAWCPTGLTCSLGCSPTASCDSTTPPSTTDECTWSSQCAGDPDGAECLFESPRSCGCTDDTDCPEDRICDKDDTNKCVGCGPNLAPTRLPTRKIACVPEEPVQGPRFVGSIGGALFASGSGGNIGALVGCQTVELKVNYSDGAGLLEAGRLVDFKPAFGAVQQLLGRSDSLSGTSDSTRDLVVIPCGLEGELAVAVNSKNVQQRQSGATVGLSVIAGVKSVPPR